MERKDYISDTQVVKRANAAVKLAIEKKNVTNTSVVVYDRKTNKICVMSPDGSKKISVERRYKERYSERVSSEEA